MNNIEGLLSTSSRSKLPIFILGCQRSGTSLLRRLFNSHSQIACPPESAFIVQLARVYEIKRALQGLLYMGFSETDVLEQMRIFTAHFFEQYARSKNKPRWADKTTHYMDHALTIDRIFKEQVLYVGIIRHGLDVAHSLCKFDWSILDPYLSDGTEKPVAAAKFWQDQNHKLLKYQYLFKKRFHLIKYEDLVADPAATMKSVFEFIGEPWEPEILDFQRFEHDTGFEDPEISKFNKIVNDSGNYKAWPVEMQGRVFEEIKDLCIKLQYSM